MSTIKIKINYITGNSFDNHSAVNYIDLKWNDLTKAKESLQRIKNHYEFFKKHDSKYKKPKSKFPLGVIWHKESRSIGLELITDKGKPYIYSPFWIGYFEKLQSAKLVYDDNDTIYMP